MIKRILLSLTLLVCATVVLGIFTWHKWIFPVAASLLENYQVELIAAEIARPGWHAVEIENLNLKYVDGSTVVSLQSPRLVMGYKVSSLFKGELESFSSEQLAVSLSRSPSGQAVTAQPGSATLPVLLPSQIIELIPIDYINIERIVLEIPEQLDFQRFTGNIRLADGQLAAVLENSEKTNLQIQLNANQEDAIGLTLRMSQTELLTLEGKAIDNEFKGTLQAKLAGISELLDRFSLTPPDYRLIGTADVKWSIPLEDTVDHIDVSNLNSSGSIAIQAQTDFPLKSTTAHITASAVFSTERNKMKFSLEKIESKGKLLLPTSIGRRFLKEPSTPLNLTVTLADNATLIYDAENQNLRTEDTSIIASLSQQQSGFTSNMEITPKEISVAQKPRIAANFKLDAQLQTFSDTSINITAPSVIASGKINGLTSNLAMLVSPGATISAQTVNTEQLTITNPKVALLDELTVQLSPDGVQTKAAALQFNSAAVSFDDQPITYSSLTCKLGPTDLNYNSGAIKTSLSGQLEGLSSRWKDYQLAAWNLEGNASLINDVLTGVFSLHDQHQLLQTQGEFKFSLPEANGELNASTQSVTFNESDRFLPQLISPAIVPLDFTAGSFLAKTKVTTNPLGTISHTDIDLTAISGFYDTNFFHGLSGNLRIADLHNQPVFQSELLKIEHINVGAELTDISFGLVPLKSGVELADFKAEIFGGQITQEQIVYEWDQPENYIVLNLHKLQLNEILQLESGISGNGTLGGVIPIIISEKGFSVRKGGVSAHAPGGIIRYETEVPLSSSAANAGLKLTLDALKNFHYTSLSTEVEYDYEGNLLLKASLQGRNPDLDETRPFHFNLNITENIPTLLKALRFSQELSDDLSQRINDFYSTN